MNENRILNYINFGYNEIEPIIIALTSLNKNFIVIGKHGTGKTKLAKFLSCGFDEGKNTFVFYDATKDDLISIAGIPSPESMKSGKLDFIKHKRTIWDKSTILVDEITRASKENQNMWLEILEEKTCFGIPLNYKTLIATANPESYASANQLDEALLDRFYAVIPVPNLQKDMTTNKISEIVRLNLNTINNKNKNSIFNKIKDLFKKIQNQYKEYYSQSNILNLIEKYTSQFISQLLIYIEKRNNNIYISPRSYGNHFPDVIASIGSYYKIIGDDNPLIKGAEDAITYCLATKFGIDRKILQQIHNNYKPMLQESNLNNIHSLRKEIAKLINIEEKILFFSKNLYLIQKTLKHDEIEYLIGSIIKDIDNNKEYLIDLNNAVNKMDKEYSNLKENIKGKLLLEFHNAHNNFTKLTTPYIKKLDNSNSTQKWLKTKFCQIETMLQKNNLLISNKPSIKNLNKFLLSLNYKDKNVLNNIIKYLKENKVI